MTKIIDFPSKPDANADIRATSKQLADVLGVITAELKRHGDELSELSTGLELAILVQSAAEKFATEARRWEVLAQSFSKWRR